MSATRIRHLVTPVADPTWDAIVAAITRRDVLIDFGQEIVRSAGRATSPRLKGRAVLFAGCTVIIAILGLFIIGLAHYRGLAMGISIGVLTIMVASVTLLPAFFGFFGRNIDKFRVPHRRRAEGDAHRSLSYRWSRVVARRPWPALIVSVLLLVVLALPPVRHPAGLR